MGRTEVSNEITERGQAVGEQQSTMLKRPDGSGLKIKGAHD